MKDLSLHLLDIVRNSIVAQASRIDLTFLEDPEQDILEMTIRDNGYGMDATTLERVTDPFYTTRTTRKVGLGLSLLKANCENADGHFAISSTPGEGTLVTARFKLSHIDRPPLGDLPATITTLLMSEEHFDLTLTYERNQRQFEFSTYELKEVMEDDLDFKDYQIAVWIETYLQEHLDAL